MTTKRIERSRARSHGPFHATGNAWDPLGQDLHADPAQTKLLRTLMRKARRRGLTAQQALDMHARGEL